MLHIALVSINQHTGKCTGGGGAAGVLGVGERERKVTSPSSPSLVFAQPRPLCKQTTTFRDPCLVRARAWGTVGLWHLLTALI